MADKNPPELQERLDQFNQHGQPKRRRGGLGVGALAATLGLGGAAFAYFLAAGLQEKDGALGTSDVETFQDQRAGNGALLKFPADDPDTSVRDALIAVEEALEVTPPAPVTAAPSTEVLEELAKLREALAASQSARNSDRKSVV